MILQELFEAGPGGSDNYAENLAQQVFNVRPNLRSEDDVLNIGYKVAVQDLMSQTRAVSLFSRDQDFPSDFVSAYYYLQKQKPGVSEGLNEFAPGAGGGDDDRDADPYRYPKPESYRRSVDFFGQFEADHFDREDFDDATGVFKGYWGSKQIAHFKFDNPAKTGSDDPGMGWYYEPEADSNDNNVSNKPAVDNSAQRKQQELSMIDAFLKSGQTPKPGSQIYGLMKQHGISEGSLNEFAPGSDGGESGHWYTDDELADIIGDDWFEDFDVSNDGFNIDAYGEKAKKNLVGHANAWFDDRGYNVNVLGVEHNDVDHDLKWYIVGSFHNPNFADKDVDEGLGSKLAGLGLAGAMALGSAGANARVTPDGQGGFTGGLKPSATVTAPADNKPAVEAPKGFSKEYLQKAADPNRFGRYMISVEKAQELLKNMQEGVAEAGYRNYDDNRTGFSKNSQAYRADGGANDENHELDQRRDQQEKSGTWYIRLNGKLIKDKQGNPYSFRGKAAANKAALTMQAKLFNQGKEFMLTTNPNDKPQGVAEGPAVDAYMAGKSPALAHFADQLDKSTGVAEGEQRVDSLVTDALKIMQGATMNDAVAALKTVLGNREYNDRRGHYNFYVRQLVDMYGQQDVAEGFDGEYDDEAGMADNNLETLKRAVEGIDDVINAGDNLPEWCQEKIAVSKSMLVSVWDYMRSEKEKN